MFLQIVALMVPVLVGQLPQVAAQELTTRRIQLSTAVPGAATQHAFSFTVPSTNPIGSMAFEYCTNSPLPYIACVPPAGLDLNAIVLSSQTGNTGFTISVPDSTANKIVLTRAVVAGVSGVSTYDFNNIINPTTAGQTTFIRIATFPTTDGSGAYTDNGSVAFATANPFQVDAYVPPFLTFCVGVFVTINCNSVTGSRVDVGELQADLTAVANMQFSGATNDGTGYTTYLNGYTMTSGNNVITALAANGASIAGTSQFGMNVRANTSPTAGLDPVGAGSSVANPAYNTPNSFRFVNGEPITSSPTSTDFKLFTATYIVNVSASQPPGVYATTMTFTAVASF